MPRSLPTPMTPKEADDRARVLKRDNAELEKLVKTRGWALITEVMHDEILSAALAIANTTQMTKDEIDFRRGAIWSANQLLNLPERLIERNTNEALFLPTTAPTEKE